ncbi:MAG: hypothetical protein JO261_11035 [Alphaproteobacteria bacterium]|nr:hypothetical protein [Alphaproteobacteria bacterium]MBV9694221.1 hypothetical protein [Alphaproteobacteria bacterium]
MKTLALSLAALVCVGLAGCERHPMKAGRAGARMMERGERAQHQGLRRACEADIAQFCASSQTGRERRICLESHSDKLSQDCKTALEARMNRRRGGQNDGGGGEDNE